MTMFDSVAHYRVSLGPTDQFDDAHETQAAIKNIGWTLGNDCPYRCTHCYSMNARLKGRDLSTPIIDRVIEQLAINNVETVNLGGNEPLFTNGPKARNTLLPYIIEGLHEAGIEIGLTTSGITLLHLARDYPKSLKLLNDVDISFDSPYKQEHNKNRGANIYHQAIEALEICQRIDKPHTMIMCGMSWNFSKQHLTDLVAIAKSYSANVRINTIKPVLPEHMDVVLTPQQYYDGFSTLLDLCDPVDLGEPPIASVTNFDGARRCPCGRTSFRIHSITPEGKIQVSPCVYLHDYKSEFDLVEHDLIDIIMSKQFRAFRQRNANPDKVEGCAGCDRLNKCGGGCAARSYLHHMHKHGKRSLTARDPYCPKETYARQYFPQRPNLVEDQKLVHMDYLCTWIGRPK